MGKRGVGLFLILSGETRRWNKYAQTPEVKVGTQLQAVVSKVIPQPSLWGHLPLHLNQTYYPLLKCSISSNMCFRVGKGEGYFSTSYRQLVILLSRPLRTAHKNSCFYFWSFTFSTSTNWLEVCKQLALGCRSEVNQWNLLLPHWAKGSLVIHQGAFYSRAGA